MFFLSECGGKSNDWDEGLDLARAMCQAAIVRRDAH
jgi:hypothetical protein